MRAEGKKGVEGSWDGMAVREWMGCEPNGPFSPLADKAIAGEQDSNWRTERVEAANLGRP